MRIYQRCCRVAAVSPSSSSRHSCSLATGERRPPRLAEPLSGSGSGPDPGSPNRGSASGTRGGSDASSGSGPDPGSPGPGSASGTRAGSDADAGSAVAAATRMQSGYVRVKRAHQRTRKRSRLISPCGGGGGGGDAGSGAGDGDGATAHQASPTGHPRARRPEARGPLPWMNRPPCCGRGRGHTPRCQRRRSVHRAAKKSAASAQSMPPRREACGGAGGSVVV